MLRCCWELNEKREVDGFNKVHRLKDYSASSQLQSYFHSLTSDDITHSFILMSCTCKNTCKITCAGFFCKQLVFLKVKDPS